MTSDVSQILEKLVEDNVLIDKVYAFMQSSHSLNPLLASFFTKVMGLLLVRKADYVSYGAPTRCPSIRVPSVLTLNNPWAVFLDRLDPVLMSFQL